MRIPWWLPALCSPVAMAQEASDLVAFPELVENATADYPPDALTRGLEADVSLLVELDDQGAVQRVEVLEPVGFGFDDAAMEAVSRMRFTPARTAEGPVEVAFEFTYAFRLSDVLPPETPPDTEEAAEVTPPSVLEHVEVVRRARCQERRKHAVVAGLVQEVLVVGVRRRPRHDDEHRAKRLDHVLLERLLFVLQD